MAAPLSPPHLLANRCILVTRAVSQSATFRTLLEAQGARVYEMPTLEIQDPSSWEPLDTAIAHLSTFQWLILTSANGVNAFFQRFNRLKTPALAAALQGLKIAVVGQKTAQFLRDHGREPTFMPDQFVADALAEQFPDPLPGCRILFPRVESGGRDILIQAFRDQGAIVDAVPAYESACPAQADPQILDLLKSGEVDLITFASSKTVVNFCRLLQQAWGDSWQTPIAEVAIASIGPQTSHTCQVQLGRVDVEAEIYTLEGLTTAIATFFTKRP